MRNNAISDIFSKTSRGCNVAYRSRSRFLYYRIMFLYDYSKMLLVDILNYKDEILKSSLERVAFFCDLFVNFSTFSFSAILILHLSTSWIWSLLDTIPTSFSCEPFKFQIFDDVHTIQLLVVFLFKKYNQINKEWNR